MFDILTLIPGKKKKTGKGWLSFNAPCCHHRGEGIDKRSRGGLTFEDEVNWTYNCFNCNFRCRFTLGKSISKNTRMLLRWLGVDDEQITKWSFESLQHKDLLQMVKINRQKRKVKFKEAALPEGELLSVDDPTHRKFVDYIHSRGLQVSDYPFLITPHEEGRNANRIVVPYTFNNKIVGHISRYLDDRTPKYIKEQQPGYIFGYDFQHPDWEVCIVVEGIFDALSINGCALTHDTISDEQAEVLRSLNRKIIVVPDIDKPGLTICDRALELGFHVAIPDWAPEIKDTNDAVRKYGKLPTLLSILQAATTSKIKIQMKRAKLDKRL
jgi:hypothetical protein